MTNDKELAKAWALDNGGQIGPHRERINATARYILSTLADDRDARIEALTSDNAKLRKALQGVLDVFNGGSCERASADFCLNVPDSVRVVVERLTKERDEALRTQVMFTEKPGNLSMGLLVHELLSLGTYCVDQKPNRAAMLGRIHRQVDALGGNVPRNASDAPVPETPAAEDADLDTAIHNVEWSVELSDFRSSAVEALRVLAARVKEMRR